MFLYLFYSFKNCLRKKKQDTNSRDKTVIIRIIKIVFSHTEIAFIYGFFFFQSETSNQIYSYKFMTLL